MRRDRSKSLFERATKLLPGGVDSPVRAFKAVGGSPIFVSRGEGAYITDADGHRYIDYVGSWGPLILGHAHATVIEAITKAARDGTSFGWATLREIELAERVNRAVPSIEMVRFVNSGTEATMSAVRAARGFTGRDKILKFSGCYHGHADPFLADAGSGIATLGIPGSAGVPIGAVTDSITVAFNDLEACRTAMATHGDSLAAVILEPVACNMGLVPPAPGFLEGLRALCDQHGVVLIFDEVITGFRVGLGGAQARYGVRPDMTTFGKVIGGGLPVGAYGGRRDIMQKIAPLGPVYQAGTLAGNPLAMAAGLATLEILEQPAFFPNLERTAAALESGVTAVLEKHGQPARFDRVGSIFYLWFKPRQAAPARDYAEIKTADAAVFARFFGALLDEGVAIAPSAFEVGFVSAAHTQQQIDATVTAIDRALAKSLKA